MSCLNCYKYTVFLLTDIMMVSESNGETFIEFWLNRVNIIEALSVMFANVGGCGIELRCFLKIHSAYS